MELNLKMNFRVNIKDFNYMISLIKKLQKIMKKKVK